MSLAYSIEGDTLYWARMARTDIEHALHNSDDDTSPQAIAELHNALYVLDKAITILDV